MDPQPHGPPTEEPMALIVLSLFGNLIFQTWITEHSNNFIYLMEFKIKISIETNLKVTFVCTYFVLQHWKSLITFTNWFYFSQNQALICASLHNCKVSKSEGIRFHIHSAGDIFEHCHNNNSCMGRSRHGCARIRQFGNPWNFYESQMQGLLSFCN